MNRFDAAGNQLRIETTAVKVSISWLGTRKTVTEYQRDAMASPFGADARAISASKRLLDSKHPTWKALVKTKGEAKRAIEEMTLPFPEDGLRLLPNDRIEKFAQEVEAYRAQLAALVCELAQNFEEIKEAARAELGDLYNPTDYPGADELTEKFGLTYSFRTIEPPQYLMQLSPAVYAAEVEKIQNTFAAAAAQAEEAFRAEFAELVAHLASRVHDNEDGTRNIFRDSAVENIREFVERFKSLNFTGGAGGLTELIEHTQRVIQGKSADDLRDNDSLRMQIRQDLTKVANELGKDIIPARRRKVLKKTAAETAQDIAQEGPMPDPSQWDDPASPTPEAHGVANEYATA
jgi:hypothetical protein